MLPRRTLEQELQPEHALADARAARHERHASLQEAAAQQRVEPGNPRAEPRGDLQRGWRCVLLEILAVARKDRDAALADHQVVPALEVRRVAQLVHLDVALALEPLLGGAEDDDPVDDRLLDPEAADLVRPVGDVGGEETDRQRVLDDAARAERPSRG